MGENLMKSSMILIRSLSIKYRNKLSSVSIFLSSIGSAFKIIPEKSRRRFSLVILSQISLGLLDLIGVALIGAIGALSIRGIQSQGPGDRVAFLLEFLRLDNLKFQDQVAVLGVLAVLILVSRTVISIILQRRILHFLSRRGAEISSLLLENLLGKSILSIQRESKQDILFLTTTGVREVSLGILGSSVAILSDGTLLVLMFLGLFIIDPTIAATSLVLLGVLSYMLNQIMSEKAHNLGRDSYFLTIKSNQKIIEALNSFRELTVRGRAGFYASEIRKSRYELSKVEAEMQFLPNVTKYTIESGVLVGTLILGAMQFLLLDASRAAATLAVFMAAGSRLAPAVLRMQHSFLQLRTSMGSADKTLNLIKDLEPSSNLDNNTKILDRNYSEFVPNVDLENVSFLYSGSVSNAVNSVSVSLAAGSVTGIVGGSGAGKTTLTDLILGVLMPNEGSIKIGGLSPESAIKRWPGGISYVPQDVAIIDGTIRENVSLGYLCDGSEDPFVWKALEVSQLSDFVKSLPEGLDSQVGDNGTRLSGGQRQRLGIARALFTMPRLIVLDEATSALDGNLEVELSDAIKNLRGEVTVILIAHRLSTLRSADQIIYLSEGRLVASGTIEQVKSLVPDFESQASLMGL